MKYWDLINVGGKTSTPTSDPQTQEVVKYVPVDTTVPEEIADNMKKILEFMEDLKNKNVEAPEGFEDTELNSDEILDVVSTLVEYHDKYFQLTPLSEELSKSFVWNLPRSIYEAHKKLRLMDEPDQLDPIYWFYSLCLADPEYMMATWIVSACNAFTDDEYDRIDLLNKMYHEDNGITSGDSSEEDDNKDKVIVEDVPQEEIVIPDEPDEPDDDEYTMVDPDNLVLDVTNTGDIDVYKE